MISIPCEFPISNSGWEHWEQTNKINYLQDMRGAENDGYTTLLIAQRIKRNGVLII